MHQPQNAEEKGEEKGEEKVEKKGEEKGEEKIKISQNIAIKALEKAKFVPDPLNLHQTTKWEMAVAFCSRPLLHSEAVKKKKSLSYSSKVRAFYRCCCENRLLRDRELSVNVKL